MARADNFEEFEATSLFCPRCRRRSEEHTSELQSRLHLVCRLLLEKKKTTDKNLNFCPSHNRWGPRSDDHQPCPPPPTYVFLVSTPFMPIDTLSLHFTPSRPSIRSH